MLDTIDGGEELPLALMRDQGNTSKRRMPMATRLKPATTRVSHRIGRLRGIAPNRARDEDLDFFLAISRQSLKAAGRYIDEMLGRA